MSVGHVSFPAFVSSCTTCLSADLRCINERLLPHKRTSFTCYPISPYQHKPIPMAATISNSSTDSSDRAKAVKEFDDSKVGVKGLVDSGIQTIPDIFIHPPETLAELKPNSHTRSGSETQIPTIDLSGVDTPGNQRSSIVDQIRYASSEFGFFQIVNHGIPLETFDRLIKSVKAFHEQPTEVKARLYRRETGTGVSFMSNVDLYKSKAASWRDTLTVRIGPNFPDDNEVPDVCRDQVKEWDREIQRLGDSLMGLLSEGLGLSVGRLKEMTCLEGRIMVGHYYPTCPQPDLTVGLTSHSDPGVLTVLLQDHVGGLQVRSSHGWVDVKPVPGALVINVGDLLQIFSNEQYISVDHRVLANPSNEPRVSIAVFFNPSDREALYGPLPELTTAGKPARYREFTLTEFFTRFFRKELDGKSLTNYFTK